MEYFRIYVWHAISGECLRLRGCKQVHQLHSFEQYCHAHHSDMPCLQSQHTEYVLWYAWFRHSSARNRNSNDLKLQDFIVSWKSLGQICSAPVILNRNLSLCDPRMLRSTSLIEGLVYVLHTKLIISARTSSFVNILFASYPNVFGACTFERRTNITSTTYASLVSGLPLVTFASSFCTSYSCICFVLGATDM